MKVCDGTLYFVNSNVSTLSTIEQTTMAVTATVTSVDLVGVADMACGPTPGTIFVVNTRFVSARGVILRAGCI